MLSMRILACLALLAFASTAEAQWSSDPATNRSLADAASDQAQPKIAPTPDGGAYVSWFDGIGSGYDVRVQKLDALGVDAFAHNGVLVANRGFSSTQDYGLDVDATGNALLAFRDDRPGGTQITAAKITALGAAAWGATGIPLTNTMEFVASPRIAGTSDGGAVIAWTQNTSVVVQKLDADGVPLWGAGVTLTPAAGSYSVSDLHGAGADVILSFVHQAGGVGSARQIRAQKFGPSGSPAWGATPVAVFDVGSLQFGNFPTFVPDGSGGAVFSWYVTSPQLQCYVQHLLANGTEAFPHNGAAVSTDGTRIRVSPSIDFDTATGATIAFWVEENTSQSQFGLYGQKLDATGGRLWGASGVTLIPLGASEISMVNTSIVGTGAFAFWASAPGFGQDRLYGMRVDGSGAVDLATFDVSSTVSDKLRLDVARSTRGFAMLAWTDARVDDGDVFVQNVNPDGTLGPSPVSVPGGEASHSVRLSRPHPNPSRGHVVLAYALPGSGAFSLTLHDSQGRLVRRLAAGTGPQRGTAAWDGLDASGVVAAPGIYFARLRSDAGVRVERIALAR